MTEYSRMVKGSFTSTGAAKIINLPFQPDYVEVTNISAWRTPALDGIPYAKWDKNFIVSSVNYTLVERYQTVTGPVIALGLVTDSIAETSGGVTTFSAGQLLQFGPTKQVVSSTGGATTSFEVTAHGYGVGDVVMFEGLFQTATTGMPQLNGLPFTVASVTDANNFVVNWNTSNATFYNNLSGSPSSAKVKKILYPYIYFPGVSFIRAITLGTTTIVSTTDAHNLRVGQQVAFRIPAAWKTVELNSLPNSLTPGAPAYGYVIAVTSFDTVVVNIDTSVGYTTFSVNVPKTQVPGLSYPQMVAVGDVNTGGESISATSPLYPPPVYVPIGTTEVPTINGPAIKGAFVNNTAQGFVIGNGPAASAAVAANSSLVGVNGNIIAWRAFLHDMNVVG